MFQVNATFRIESNLPQAGEWTPSELLCTEKAIAQIINSKVHEVECGVHTANFLVSLSWEVLLNHLSRCHLLLMEDHCEPVKKTTTTTEKYDNICTFEHGQCFIFVFILNYIDFGWLFASFMSHICPNRVRSQHITRSLLSFFGHIIIGVVTSLFFTVYCFFRFIDHFYCYYTCLAVTIKALMALQSCCSAPDIIQ